MHILFLKFVISFSNNGQSKKGSEGFSDDVLKVVHSHNVIIIYT